MPRSRFRVTRGRDPLNSQSFRTQRPDLPEDLWQPLYDRANVATSVPSEVAFFSVPKGQSATLITGTSAASKNKTFRDTNMETSSVVPTKMFKFVGISLAVIHSSKTASTNANDRQLLLEGGYIQFRIVDKDLLFLPLLNFPVLNPISAVATTANDISITAQNSGGGEGTFMYKLPINITLNPYENFTVSCKFDGTITLANTVDLIVVLQGFQRRPT